MAGDYREQKLNIKVEILEIKKINNLMKFDENIFKFSEFMSKY